MSKIAEARKITRAKITTFTVLGNNIGKHNECVTEKGFLVTASLVHSVYLVFKAVYAGTKMAVSLLDLGESHQKKTLQLIS